MTDEPKTTESRPVESLKVAVISTGDAAPLPSGTVATTSGAHMPDIIVSVVSPLAAILIRFGNLFLTTLVALMTAGGMTGAIPFTDFFHLLRSCAMLAISVAGLGFLKDLITVFGKLEQKFPLLTGSV